MIHFDQARKAAREFLADLAKARPEISRVVLIDDLFGRMRIVVWVDPGGAEAVRRMISEKLPQIAGPFWSGDLWIPKDSEEPNHFIYETAWEEAIPISEKFRRADRHRSRGSWLNPPTQPLWDEAAPPVIAFYSFKGGVGRTTALASFAVQRARRGDRVVVVDLDVEAPGVGSLLTANDRMPGAQWGILDYLLEQPIWGPEPPELRDYFHVCARSEVTGPGEIDVFPAGSIGEDFLAKLTRVDFEPATGGRSHPLANFLKQTRSELTPDWILLDCRAGVSEASGFALSGMADLTVLFGTLSEQSWQGLRLVLKKIGAERIRNEQQQLDCLLVQALVPEEPLRQDAESRFRERAEDEFREHYYAADPVGPDEDALWYVRDMTTEEAPHVPVALPYKRGFTFLNTVDESAEDLATDQAYVNLMERISSRFAPAEVGEEP